MIDLFGEWVPIDSMTLPDLRGVSLPPVVVPIAKVMGPAFELDGSGRIPYKILDRMRLEYGIDSTALSVSMTPDGNLYRSYVLLRGHSLSLAALSVDSIACVLFVTSLLSKNDRRSSYFEIIFNKITRPPIVS